MDEVGGVAGEEFGHEGAVGVAHGEDALRLHAHALLDEGDGCARVGDVVGQGVSLKRCRK